MKRFIVLLVVISMFLAVSTTAFAFVDTNLPFLFKTANATPTIDGVKDEAYDNSDMIDVMQVGLPALPIEGQATAKVWTLWDDANIYVYAEVTDTTPSTTYFDGINPWLLDSVEVYVDFANTKASDANVHKQELTGQIRFCRTAEYPEISGSGFYTEEVKNKIEFKVIDNGAEGYVVEAAIPHRNLAKKVGFSFQINDDVDDDQIRDATTFIKDMGYLACQYNRVFDTLELEGCTARNGLEDESIVYNTIDDLRSINTPTTDEPASSEETTSVEETPSSEDASSDVAESTSSEATVSLDAPQTTSQATLDPVVTLIVFVVSAAAIVVIIVLATKKK